MPRYLPVFVLFRKGTARASMLRRMVESGFAATASSGKFPRGSPGGTVEQEESMPDGIIGWILIGLVAGALGKLIMPGKDPGGIIVTILIGIAGALLAAFVAPAIGINLTGKFASYIAATIGAVVLLALYRVVIARRAA